MKKMIYKKIKYIFFLLPVIILSSCFEIIEEINLNEDGSGTFLFTINLSQSKTKLASIMLMDSINNYRVPDRSEIDLQINQFLDFAKEVEGINDIEDTRDFDNFIFSIKCSFDDLSTLNLLASKIKAQYKVDPKINPDNTHFVYDADSKSFYRKGAYFIQEDFKRLKAIDQEIFTDANYISIYRFKDQIKEVENQNARISPNKKAVMLKINAMDFIKGDASIINRINLVQ